MYICNMFESYPPLYCQIAVGLGFVPLDGLTKFFLALSRSMHPFI